MAFGFLDGQLRTLTVLLVVDLGADARLVGAIAARDPAAAEQAMRNHLERATRVLFRR